MSSKRTTIIEVRRRPSETSGGLVRRFAKKVQQMGLVRKTRAGQFRTRPLSQKRKKASALRRIIRAKETMRLRKLGKIPEKPKRGQKRR